jgi:hypothetical protein
MNSICIVALCTGGLFLAACEHEDHCRRAYYGPNYRYYGYSGPTYRYGYSGYRYYRPAVSRGYVYTAGRTVYREPIGERINETSYGYYGPDYGGYYTPQYGYYSGKGYHYHGVGYSRGYVYNEPPPGQPDYREPIGERIYQTRSTVREPIGERTYLYRSDALAPIGENRYNDWDMGDTRARNSEFLGMP